MEDILPPHVAAAMQEPCAERGTSASTWLALGLTAAALAVWAAWPVPEPTPQERAALEAMGVVLAPPGRGVCPASVVPLQWATGLQDAIGWQRMLMLSKAGWKFYTPAAKSA
jgi:hypothetical protein